MIKMTYTLLGWLGFVQYTRAVQQYNNTTIRCNDRIVVLLYCCIVFSPNSRSYSAFSAAAVRGPTSPAADDDFEGMIFFSS